MKIGPQAELDLAVGGDAGDAGEADANDAQLTHF
jgi:hypothetical protein